MFTQTHVYGRAHEILVRITHAQKPPLNDHTVISSGARGPSFSLGVHLHPLFHPGKSVPIRKSNHGSGVCKEHYA